MRVMIAGGSGYLGNHLADSLLADGHQVWVLSRSPDKRRLPVGAIPLTWDGRTTSGWGGLVSQMDAIVNLTGATTARWPWTAKRKLGFLNSRVWSAQAIVEAIRAADPRPQVLVQQSAGGFYGPHGDEPVIETMPPGDDFSARLCRDWEAASQPVETLGVRRVVTRTGIVISRDAEILQLMALPVRLFFGGRLGSGKQGIGWIHLDDEIGAFRFLLENSEAHGAYNLAAPGPVSNSEFMRLLARALRRPHWVHYPAPLLRLFLGEMSTLIVDGWFLRPERLEAAGFQFKYPDLGSALDDIWRKGP